MKQNSIKFNFIMNVILTMSSIIFPLISYPYVSRIVQPEGIGKVSFATSFLTYFSLIAQLGIPIYGVRVCAQCRDDNKRLSQTVQELLTINVFTTLIAYFVFYIFIFSIDKFCNDRVLYILMSSSICLNTIGMEWLYKALEQYKFITIRSVLFKFIALLAMLFLIKDSDDYILYGCLSIFAASASNIINFINVHKLISLKRHDRLDLTKHFKPILIFFMMSCATTIYTHIDTVMLGFLKTDADVGYYDASVKVKSVLISIVGSLGTVLLPRLSFYIKKGQNEQFYEISQKALNFVCLAAVPLIVYFIIYAKSVIMVLSGESFNNAIYPMRIILPSVLFIGLTNIIGIQMLVPLGREKVVLFSEVSGAIVNAICNMLLIPKYSSCGASVGTLIAECVVFICQFYSLRSVLIPLFKKISYLNIIISVISASIVSVPFIFMNLKDIIKLILSFAIFVSCYAITLLFTKEKLFSFYFWSFCNKIKNKFGSA